ncbi:battenin-like [Condylostylus longicornis]|uniref:battenin-like n=1 Tax=Condylostylus longicornis TaxID=2530218 RepID=UPI00244E243C|nr:battenin-like [Condylostylus longicornis]XP_055385597.1 battenin-like [Condylostylus longicornis]XP_055385598.1 battenin-like [Condylostylus longicornis]XP_055385599.1 battenin-like [Condylostylus longicornis]
MTLNENKEKLPEINDNNNKRDKKSIKVKDPELWRDLLAFWILGLCNNYGYKVMLSAAHDIIGKFDEHGDVSEQNLENSRQCHLMSTGAVLLADIIPSLIVKLSGPFLPFWVNVRILLAISLTVAGFCLVGFAQYQWMALFGVTLISASAGLGESTFLAYSSQFNRNVVSTWSSGTGGAGLIGSLSYAALRSAGVNTLITMLIMLIVPGLECVAFWIILRKPSKIVLPTSNLENSYDIDKIKMQEKTENEINNDEKPLVTLKEKIYYIVYLLRYMIPLTVVYLAEYFINQGLFELVNFKNTSLDKASQYRWLNVDYQIGVLISRSTVNLFSVSKIVLFPIFQMINVIYFLNEVIFYITPTIWIVFVIVLWEGLLGGGAYVNTFYKMSKDIPVARRQFALSVVAIADSIGITLAGFISLPVHNAICHIPEPQRLYEF